VVFGGAVLEQVLGKRVAFESMRGRWIELNGVRLMPTHALSHMLINPLMKKETWKDLQLVMKYLK
jgi:uracil-DNA glycosylase